MPEREFEFIVEGPPVSICASGKSKHSTKRYRGWINRVRAAAHARWPPAAESTDSPAVAVTIVNYYTLYPGDIDNIIKPILDALNTLVYEDDKQVYKVTSMKSRQEITDNPSPIVAGAAARFTEFLHIVVSWPEEE